jgi:hypothetical protein
MSDRLALANAIEDAGGSRRRRRGRGGRAELQAVRSEVQGMQTNLKGDIALIEHRLLGGLVVVTGVIRAALRYWLPGHG